MDHDREELIAINKEINRLVSRLSESNWKKEVVAPTVDALETASTLLYRARIQVGAAEE